MNLWNTLFGTATSGSANTPTGLPGSGPTYPTATSSLTSGFAQFFPVQTVSSTALGSIYTTTGTTFGQSAGVSITKIAVEGDDVVLYMGTAPYYAAYARIPLAVLREVLGPILEKALLGAFK